MRAALVLSFAAAVAGCSTSSGPAAAGGAGAGATGVPAPASAFERVRAGMTEQQVLALLGPPAAEGTYVPRLERPLALLGAATGRRTYFYARLGRVLFDGGGPVARTGTVVRVERDPDEPGRTP